VADVLASAVGRQRWKRLLGGASILLLGFGLLVWDLDGVALSGDEIGNVLIESGDLQHIFDSMATAWSQHPPASHIFNAVGLRLFGTSDFGARAASVIVSTVGLALMHRFGTLLLGPRRGLLSCLLLATAPAFVLYGRMEKYYALVIALSLLLNVLLLEWLRKRGIRFLAWYGLLMAVMWYTDYLAAGLIGVTHFVWLMLWPRVPRKAFLSWAIVAAASVVLFIPWLAVLRAQVGAIEAAPTADLATGPVAFIGKLAFFAYSYGVGETIFPWQAPAVAGVVLVAMLAATAFRQSAKAPGERRVPLLLLLTAFAIPSVGLTLLSLTPLLDTVPLITLPNHVIFALPPFLGVLVAAPRWSRWRDWALALLVALGAPALLNIYEGRQYFNPAHANPSREAVAYVVENAEPGDVVLTAEPDIFSFYLDPAGASDLVLVLADAPDAESICNACADRLWVVTIGRDRTRASAPTELLDSIEGHMTREHCTGFGEQDATYRSLKELLTGRPAYLYRVLVCLYRGQ
jgi:hypothetical protein